MSYICESPLPKAPAETIVSRLLSEELTPLCEAAKFVPRPPGKRPLHASTIQRWHSPGLGTPRVRLETILIGSVRHTSREAVLRFLEAINTEIRQAAASESASVRKRQSLEAKQKPKAIL